MTPRDLELRAYDAALSDDDETMLASVRQINEGNRIVIEHALKSWMLRTKYVLMCLAAASGHPIAFAIELHDCDGDHAKIDPEVAWAGQLFSAYVADDGDQWETLLAALPEEPDDLANLLCNILKMLTVVAVSANEDLSQHIEPTGGPTPMRRSALLAHAHLN